MLPGDQCSGGVSELAEGYTYMRGRCKQLGGLQVGDREELECFSASEYDALILKDGLFHRSESFDQRSEDICRRISICKRLNYSRYFLNFTVIILTQVSVIHIVMAAQLCQQQQKTV